MIKLMFYSVRLWECTGRSGCKLTWDLEKLHWRTLQADQFNTLMGLHCMLHLEFGICPFTRKWFMNPNAALSVSWKKSGNFYSAEECWSFKVHVISCHTKVTASGSSHKIHASMVLKNTKKEEVNSIVSKKKSKIISNYQNRQDRQYSFFKKKKKESKYAWSYFSIKNTFILVSVKIYKNK